jgi:hypothetical protein
MNGVDAFNKLLVSLAGIFIFISLAYFIDLNGFTSLSPVLILAGIGILLFSDEIAKKIKTPWISKSIILTVSHVLIFVGLKVYLDQYVSQYWLVYLIVGVLLLNNSRLIAKKIANLI